MDSLREEISDLKQQIAKLQQQQKAATLSPDEEHKQPQAQAFNLDFFNTTNTEQSNQQSHEEEDDDVEDLFNVEVPFKYQQQDVNDEDDDANKAISRAIKK